MTVLGSAMYNREYTNQMRIEDFAIPFGGKLNPENRWVKLAEITLWRKIEDYYAKVMYNGNSRVLFIQGLPLVQYTSSSQKNSLMKQLSHTFRKTHMFSTISDFHLSGKKHCLTRQ